MPQTLQAQTQNDDKEARLKVAKAERGDTGKYTIKVANAHGEDSADINVIVLGQFLTAVMLPQRIISFFILFFIAYQLSVFFLIHFFLLLSPCSFVFCVVSDCHPDDSLTYCALCSLCLCSSLYIFFSPPCSFVFCVVRDCHPMTA